MEDPSDRPIFDPGIKIETFYLVFIISTISVVEGISVPLE